MQFFNFLAIVVARLALLSDAAVARTSSSSSVRQSIHQLTAHYGHDMNGFDRPRPSSNPTAQCINPPVRSEWRTLSTDQKKEYIDAVLCFSNLPAKSGINGTVNRYDDFHAVHNNQTPNIHWVGHFILWHRYFTASYEKALIDECGLSFGQPYWNWSLDVSSTNFSSVAVYSNPVFDPETGFGGNGPYLEATAAQNPFNFTGRTGGGCVTDGPFTNTSFMVNFPGPSVCLTRDFMPHVMNEFAQQSLVDEVVASKDYTAFAKAVENVPDFDFPNIHGSGHFGVGGALGTIGDAYNSPGDPLFYLHHSNLDRILTLWQSVNLTQRLNEVGGPVTPFDYGGVNVTLEFEIGLGLLAANITLLQALNSQADVMCYEYATLDK